jgi:hypothetical protein
MADVHSACILAAAERCRCPKHQLHQEPAVPGTVPTTVCVTSLYCGNVTLSSTYVMISTPIALLLGH